MTKEKFAKLGLLTKSLLELLDIFHLTHVIEIEFFNTGEASVFENRKRVDLATFSEKWLSKSELHSLTRKFYSIYDITCYAMSLHESNREKLSYCIQVLNLLRSLDSSLIAKKSFEFAFSAEHVIVPLRASNAQSTVPEDNDCLHQLFNSDLFESIERAAIVEQSHVFRKLGENASYLDSLRSLAYTHVGYMVARSIFRRYVYRSYHLFILSFFKTHSVHSSYC
jgi:hypothetical protein